MKEYYYLEGKDQRGPYSIAQLLEENLKADTYVWTDDMDDWRKLKEIPDLYKMLGLKSTPPPPPNEVKSKTSSVEEPSGELSQANHSVLKILPNELVFLILWCAFHLFALLTSYSQIAFFNKKGKPKTSEFWPFVKFNDCYNKIEWFGYDGSGREGRKVGENCFFRGVFVDYDWSEFSFYIGLVLIFLLLYKISNRRPNDLANGLKS